MANRTRWIDCREGNERDKYDWEYMQCEHSWNVFRQSDSCKRVSQASLGTRFGIEEVVTSSPDDHTHLVGSNTELVASL